MNNTIKRFLAIIGISLVPAAEAAAEASVFMMPESNILWRTALDGDLEIPIFMPAGATSASLAVKSGNCKRIYTVDADGMFALSLPSADSADDENVYELELTFNDEASTTYRARIAVLASVGQDCSAVAEIRRAGSRKWPHVVSKAVLPVPDGVDEVSVDDVKTVFAPADTPGWFLLRGVKSGFPYNVSLLNGESVLAEAELCGVSPGLKLILK